MANNELPPYTQERQHARELISLAAVGTAARTARLFIRDTLTRWQATVIEDDTLTVASELVSNAVKATGTTGERPTYADMNQLNLIHVHLVALDNSVVIEVWDSSPANPQEQPQDDDAESGRGLFLVEALSERWGSCLAGSGKVVWAEMTRPLGLWHREPKRKRSKPPPAVLADPDFLRRVLVGLARL